jgi:hypothetical protein
VDAGRTTPVLKSFRNITSQQSLERIAYHVAVMVPTDTEAVRKESTAEPCERKHGISTFLCHLTTQLKRTCGNAVSGPRTSETRAAAPTVLGVRTS